jgi:serine/threonine protein phosphatase 1
VEKISYVIGDVHGCLLEFKTLEQSILLHAKANAFEPYIVFVGDLIDRGPSSYELVNYVLKNPQTHGSVLGNHEVEFLRNIFIKDVKGASKIWELFSPWFKKYIKHLSVTPNYESWLAQGGLQTLESYGFLDHTKEWDIPEEHIRFLSSLPIYYEDSNVVVTHALMNKIQYSMICDDKNYKKMTTAAFHSFKSVLWSRQLPEEPCGVKYHVSGHTDLHEARILTELKIVQIDTGCVFGNKLSAYCTKTGEIIDVEKK